MNRFRTPIPMPIPEVTPAPVWEEAPPPSVEPETDFAFWNIDVDWLAVGLGLVALIAVGGLIPFWMWIYFSYNSPIK